MDWERAFLNTLCRPAHEADEEACEDDVLRTLAGDELEIGIGAVVEGALKLFERVVDGAFGSDAEAIGVEAAVFLARQKIRFLRREFGECP
jgi:hypothetical protein